MIAPHLDVGLGDAGVGSQHEQHGMGVGQHVEGEFRFGADGIEPRRIEDHQALLQQGMRKVDDGVAPAGNLHSPVFMQGKGVILVAGVEKPVARRLVLVHPLDLADLLKGAQHALGGTHVERKHLPLVDIALVFGGGGIGGAGFDRQ